MGRSLASASARGITPWRLPVPATSGGVTLAAWLERVTTRPVQWTVPSRPICGGEGGTQAFVPGPRAQGHWYVVCTMNLIAARWHCGGTAGGNRATFGSPSFFLCGLSRSWLVLLRRENIIQRTLCTQLIESRGNSSTLAQARRPMTRLVITQSGLGPSQPSKQVPLLDSCALPQFSNMIHTETPVDSQTKITRIVLFATRKVQKKHFTPC